MALPTTSASTLPTTWSQRAHYVNDTYRAFGMGNASEADLATWSQLIGNGSSRVVAANGATDNDWWRASLVDTAYSEVLDRHPAPNVRATRAAALASGGTRAGLYAALYGSAEFVTLSGGTRTSFITRLFQGTVHRSPTTTEVSGWTNRLASGTTTLAAATSLVNSVSARGIRVDADYRRFLGRTATATIRSHWITNIGTKDELVLQKSLAVSDEFFADSQVVALPAGAVAPPTPPTTTKGGKAVALAETQVGVNYVYGGETPGVGFDCSGLAQWAYAGASVTIPRTTYDQVTRPTAVALSKIQPGDLVFYFGSGHVAIYVGNGLVIHAPSTGDVVRYADLDLGTPEHVVRPG